MLDDLRPFLDLKKANDLLARLSQLKPEQALGAEMELGLLWGIQQVADIEIEPVLANSSKRPEARSASLFGEPSYIEITTLSDGRLSGEERMHRAANKIVDFANMVKKGSGEDLYFTFDEIRLWNDNGYTREHYITDDFELDQALRDQISFWINAQPEPNRQALQLQNECIGVTIEKRNRPQRRGFNFFSRLPALAYNLEKNPLYDRLEEKARQLSGVRDGALKVIFVADGGSRILRLIRDSDPQRLYKSGTEIISRFLNKSSVHVVCVFSPLRESFFPRSKTLRWEVSLFKKGARQLNDDKIGRLAEALPVPRFEAYQARSLQKQGVFDPSRRGSYLGTWIMPGGISTTMKISARLLQELVAGKISREEFVRSAFGDRNEFGFLLDRGYTIKNAGFESAGIDEDDDHLVFEFAPDPAASRLK